MGALLRTPLAKGLFQNAIVQSQPSFMPAKGAQVYNDMNEMQESVEQTVKEAIEAMNLSLAEKNLGF